MVGYVLGLSNACPVHYGLLFERFTDPDRSEYPDIDIDICQNGRQEIIDYVRQKYGHVAQIITFGTLKARAAIRDIRLSFSSMVPMRTLESDRLRRSSTASDQTVKIGCPSGSNGVPRPRNQRSRSVTSRVEPRFVGSKATARAKDSNCRSPTDSVTPRSLTSVW